jgi:hypothetical protein
MLRWRESTRQGKMCRDWREIATMTINEIALPLMLGTTALLAVFLFFTVSEQ